MLNRLPHHLLLWTGALLLAAVASAAALAGVAGGFAPRFAAGLWPANGPVFDAVADRAIRAGTSVTGPRIPEELALSLPAMARAALAVEPAAANSLRILALDHQAHGRTAAALRTMQLAATITKRDLLANFWLIDHYGRAGDVEAMLTAYDHTLRTIGDGRGPVLRLMAASLADERLIVPLYRLLRQRPPWAESFWNAVAQMPSAVDNAARLRILVARSGIGVSPEKDAMLLGALAEQRLFDRGRQLHAALRPSPEGPAAGPVNNGDFTRPAELPPFDWQLASTGEHGAGIDPRAGTLEISALGDASGEVARQLVRLEPGRYELAVTSVLRSDDRSGSVRVELDCAEEEAGTPLRFELAPGLMRRAVDLSGERCRHFWLRISVQTPEESDGLDVSIERLQLHRL